MLPPVDFVFVYSPRGAAELVKATFGQSFLLGAMGKRTAEILQEKYRLSFIGNGDASAAAKTITEMFSIDSIAFIEAQNSLKSVEKLLDSSIKKYSVVVYSNTPRIIDLPSIDIAVLTSPMNVQAFQKSMLQKPSTFIVIGETTAQAVRNTFQVEPIIASSTDEEQLYQAVLDQLM